MQVPKGKSIETIEVKKSKFISIGMYVSSPEEAKKIIQNTRKEYSDSSHVVYAWLCGPKGDIFGFSDDREPSGTAGRPVLEVLKGSGIDNIIILVVRYFGGTKLGTGGLARAYSSSAKKVLESLAVEELVVKVRFKLTTGYHLYDQILKILKIHNAEPENPLFDTDIHISGSIPERELSAASSEIKDISSGKVELVTV